MKFSEENRKPNNTINISKWMQIRDSKTDKERRRRREKWNAKAKFSEKFLFPIFKTYASIHFANQMESKIFLPVNNKEKKNIYILLLCNFPFYNHDTMLCYIFCPPKKKGQNEEWHTQNFTINSTVELQPFYIDSFIIQWMRKLDDRNRNGRRVRGK